MDTRTLNGCSPALRTWTEAPTEGILAVGVIVPAASAAEPRRWSSAALTEPRRGVIKDKEAVTCVWG